MARILLGVTGGIAAYKALELARLATKEGHAIRVLMTPAAQRFIGAASFEGIVGAPVLSDEFEVLAFGGAHLRERHRRGLAERGAEAAREGPRVGADPVPVRRLGVDLAHGPAHVEERPDRVHQQRAGWGRRVCHGRPGRCGGHDARGHRHSRPSSFPL